MMNIVETYHFSSTSIITLEIRANFLVVIQMVMQQNKTVTRVILMEVL